MDNRKLFVAYIWNLIGTVVPRSLGIVSTLILVRLLSPEDFGLVAIATLVIGFFAVISEIGAYRYLILKVNPTDETYNACWTFNILVKSLSITVLILLAPFIADYLSNPEATSVIQIMSLIQVIGLFKNIGIVKFEKEVNYGPTNKLLIFAKFVSFFFTLTAAFYYQNYYALVIGSAANMLALLIGSYIVSDYRPKMTLALPRDLMSFSWYLALRNILGYSRSQIDTLLVGRFYGNAALGYFNVTKQFSNIPLNEVVGPVMSPLFAALSSTTQSKENARDGIYKLLFFIWLFLAPWVSYFYVLGHEFTVVILGEKWLEVSPLLGPIALLMLAFASQSIVFMLYDIMDKTKLSIFNDILGLALIITAFGYYSPSNLFDFSIIRQYVAIASIFVIFILAMLFLKLEAKKLILCAGLPIILSFSTYEFIVYMKTHIISFDSPIASLLVFSLFGFIQYIFAILLTSFVVLKTSNSLFLRSLFELFTISSITQIMKRLKTSGKSA